MKQAALAATKGKWEWWTSNSHLRLSVQGGRDGGVLYGATLHDGCGTVVISEEDAAHIVVSDPAAVLKLVAANEALVAALKKFANIDESTNSELWLIRADYCEQARAALKLAGAA